MGLTLLQLDSGRGVGNNLCPLQGTCATALVANIENNSNADNIALRCMVRLHNMIGYPLGNSYTRLSPIA